MRASGSGCLDSWLEAVLGSALYWARLIGSLGWVRPAKTGAAVGRSSVPPFHRISRTAGPGSVACRTAASSAALLSSSASSDWPWTSIQLTRAWSRASFCWEPGLPGWAYVGVGAGLWCSKESGCRRFWRSAGFSTASSRPGNWPHAASPPADSPSASWPWAALVRDLTRDLPLTSYRVLKLPPGPSISRGVVIERSFAWVFPFRPPNILGVAPWVPGSYRLGVGRVLKHLSSELFGRRYPIERQTSTLVS